MNLEKLKSDLALAVKRRSSRNWRESDRKALDEKIQSLKEQIIEAQKREDVEGYITQYEKTEKLEIYSVTKKVRGEKKEVYFLEHIDGTKINLSEIIPDEIYEIQEIYKDDLIFITVADYTCLEHTGIYSYKQKKIVFPFIIEEFNTNDESGYIYVVLAEDLAKDELLLKFDLNPDNNFAYLHSDGSFFQNERIIEEKIRKHDDPEQITNKPTSDGKEKKGKKPKSEIYSNKIKSYLQVIKMSQRELADRVGTNIAHISKIINGGRKSISLPIAFKIWTVINEGLKENKKPTINLEQLFIYQKPN